MKGSLKEHRKVDHLEHRITESTKKVDHLEYQRMILGDTGLGHGVGLGDQHGGMSPFRVTLGDTGLGHGMGLGDQHGGMRPV